MDAHALLTSQGWRGSGHSLHPSSDTTGLRRPILVARKQNVLGIGKKQHHTSDLWWQNAFDSSLKGLDTSQQGKVVQTVTNGGLDMAVKGGGRFVGSGGLYACFVRGESLSGTLTPEEVEEEKIAVQRRSVEKALLRSVAVEVGEKKKKSKREGESEVERRARKAKKAAKRAMRLQESETMPTVSEVEDRDPMVEQATAGLEMAETAEERKARKRQRKALQSAQIPAVEPQSAEEQKLKKKRKKSGTS